MDRTMMRRICLIVAVLSGPLFLPWTPASAAGDAPDPVASLIHEIRVGLQGDSKAIIAANLELSPQEAEVFWPVYDAYLAEQIRLGERVWALIEAYARGYNSGSLSEGQAEDLLKQWLRVAKERYKLKKKYARKFRRVLPAAKALRCLQLENKIDAVIQMDYARDIPLAR